MLIFKKEFQIYMYMDANLHVVVIVHVLGLFIVHETFSIKLKIIIVIHL